MSDIQVSKSPGSRGIMAASLAVLAIGSTVALVLSLYQWGQVGQSLVRMEESAAGLRNSVVALDETDKIYADRLERVEAELQAWSLRAAMWEQSNEAWLLEQAKYLIRVAEERLHYFGEAAYAYQHLMEAQRCLADVKNVSVRPLKEALIEQSTILASVKGVDLEAQWLALSQIRAGLLALPTTPMVYIESDKKDEKAQKSAIENTEKATWQRQLERLEGYVRLQEHKVETPAPVLQMAQKYSALSDALSLIELARWTLLSYQPKVYQESINALKDKLIKAYSQSQEGQVLIGQIEQLEAVPLASMPSLHDLVALSKKTQLMPVPATPVNSGVSTSQEAS